MSHPRDRNDSARASLFPDFVFFFVLDIIFDI